MQVSKITPNFNYGININNKRIASINFGYREIAIKPIVNNENGKKILDKAIQYIKVLPEKAKTMKPISVVINEGNIEKTYGIMIEKNSDTCKITIRNLKDANDKALTCHFNEKGRMIIGDYDGMHFYRTSDAKQRMIETQTARYTPIEYSADKWGLTTYGSHSAILDNTGKDEETLGSIFWAMTGLHTSIYA